jgi:hypothetical protein
MTRSLSLHRPTAVAYGTLAAALVAIVLLTGCGSNATLSPAAQQAIVNLCAQDAALQPIAVPVAAGVATAAAPHATGAVAAGVALDQSVLHPAVQNACAAVGTLPVAPTVTPTVPAAAGVKTS